MRLPYYNYQHLFILKWTNYREKSYSAVETMLELASWLQRNDLHGHRGRIGPVCVTEGWSPGKST